MDTVAYRKWIVLSEQTEGTFFLENRRAAKNREVSLRKETEVQCGIVRLLYEDGSLSEKEYEDIVELLYAKEKGGKQK